jgi:hypothetical protein
MHLIVILSMKCKSISKHYSRICLRMRYEEPAYQNARIKNLTQVICQICNCLMSFNPGPSKTMILCCTRSIGALFRSIMLKQDTTIQQYACHISFRDLLDCRRVSIRRGLKTLFPRTRFYDSRLYSQKSSSRLIKSS